MCTNGRNNIFSVIRFLFVKYGVGFHSSLLIRDHLILEVKNTYKLELCLYKIMESGTRKKFAAVLAVVFVILAGLSVYFVFFDQNQTESSDPESTEVVGYWEGMYHDEQIESVRDDRVPREDLDKVKNRAIARLEVIRNEPMQDDVEIEIRTREEFRQDNPFQYESDVYSSWSNMVWFGQLVVPGQVDIQNVRNSLRGNQTLAYYLITEDTLVLIVEETEDGYVYVDEESLVHELTHAMQDQRMGLENDKIHSKITTVRQSQLSLIEGEARLVESQFNQRCAETWDCLEYQTEYSESEYNLPGYQAVSLAPYEAGETYMQSQYEEGGWEEVDDTYTESPPVTMAEIIYPDQDHSTEYVQVQDISQGSWEPYGLQGTDGQDHLGMANLSSMLYHYESQYIIQTGVEGAGDVRNIATGGYQYQTELTEELEHDGIMPYRTPNERTGFVWTQVWESSDAANQFTNIYTRVLSGLGGDQIENPEYELMGDSINEHMVYSGPSEYQGYFSIARNDEMVVITYSETQAGLSNLRPSRSEPISIKQYETGEYERPNYEITTSEEANQVNENENDGLGVGDYLTLIVFVVCSVIYLIFSLKATKRN